MNRAYRRLVHRGRVAWGRSPLLNRRLEKICRDKIRTWRLLAPYQPASLPLSRWGPRAARWLDGLDAAHVLAKPPRGSCGRGIEVLHREEVEAAAPALTARGPVLLQEFVPSRPLPDAEGRPHLGCIRHIAFLTSDGRRLDFTHLPSYWRVAAAPFDQTPARAAFTANISTGAYPAPLAPGDRERVTGRAVAIGTRLVRHALGVPALAAGRSADLAAGGSPAS